MREKESRERGGGGVKAERIKDTRAKEEDLKEQKVRFATLLSVLEFLLLLVDYLQHNPSIHALCTPPCTTAPALWAALQQQCATGTSVVFVAAHLVAASGWTDPFFCFWNPGFAEID